MVGAAVADEAELPLEVGNGFVESCVRAQVAVEAAVLGIEFEHRLGVVDGGLDLGSAAYDARIGKQPA